MCKSILLSADITLSLNPSRGVHASLDDESFEGIKTASKAVNLDF